MKFVVNVKEREWTTFVSNNKKSHFLQSYEWGELSKIRKLTPYYVGLKNNNDDLVATSLLLQKHLPFGYSYFYIPRGYVLDYTDYDLIKEFTEKINKFTKSRKSIFFKIDPDIKLHNIDKSANPTEGENNYKLVNYLKKIGFKSKPKTYHFETMQPRFTFRIDLDRTIDEIESKYSTTTKQRIKKAEKYGSEVFCGNEKDINIFCDLMKKTEKVKGFYSHDDDFYKNFYKIFSKNNNVSLYIGKVNINKVVNVLKNDLKGVNEELQKLNEDKEKNAKKIGQANKRIDKLNKDIDYYSKFGNKEVYTSSYLTVNYGDKSWALYAGNDPELKNLFTNYLVYKYQIRNTKKMDKKIFDVFGTIGDPNNNTKYVGLHEFKKKFGGEYTEFIGEYDYIQNHFIYFIFTKLVPLRHKIINNRLRKKVS